VRRCDALQEVHFFQSERNIIWLGDVRNYDATRVSKFWYAHHKTHAY